MFDARRGCLMKIKTNTVLTNLQGETLKENEKEVTLALVVAAALVAVETEDPKLAYQLAQRVTAAPEADITANEMVFIQAAIEKSSLPTLIKGQALTLLDA